MYKRQQIDHARQRQVAGQRAEGQRQRLGRRLGGWGDGEVGVVQPGQGDEERPLFGDELGPFAGGDDGRNVACWLDALLGAGIADAADEFADGLEVRRRPSLGLSKW